MKKFLSILIAMVMALSLCCACGETGGGETGEKPEKIKDGTVLIDLSGSGSYTATVADYVDEKGSSPTYAVRCDSDNLYVWDVANGLFTIDAYAVCDAVPVYLDVLLGDALQFTVTLSVTVYNGAPVLNGGEFDVLEVDLGGTKSLEVDLRDYVTYSDNATDVTFKATAASGAFTVAVEGSKLTVTGVSYSERGEITVEVYKTGSKKFDFKLYVNVTDSSREATKKGDPTSSVDLTSAQSVEIKLSDYVEALGVSGLTYEFKAAENAKYIAQRTAEGFRIIPTAAGSHTYSVDVLQKGVKKFSLNGSLSVTGEFPKAPVNGDFETGNLNGWTGTGDYLNVNATSSAEKFWEDLTGDAGVQGLPFNREGNYFLDMGYSSGSRTGTLTSTYFMLGQNRWLSFMLGAGANIQEAYMSIRMLNDDGTETEIARFGNTQFYDSWPWNVAHDGVRETGFGLNRYKFQYAEKYVGKVVYIRLVDTRSDSFYAGLTVDSIKTDLAADPGADYVPAMNRRVEYDKAQLTGQIQNGSFEQGLEGWTIYGNKDVQWNDYVSTEEYFWSVLDQKEGLGVKSNKEGEKFWSCFSADTDRMADPSLTKACDLMYTMRSPAFVLGGNGYVSFRLGNGRYDGNYSGRMYVSVWKYNANGEDELIARYNNYKFYDMPGWSASDIGVTCFNLNMVQYYADLSAYKGEVLYFEITDLIQADNWAGVNIDDFRTDYSQKPEGYEAQYVAG